jgi:hypothetical protein
MNQSTKSKRSSNSPETLEASSRNQIFQISAPLSSLPSDKEQIFDQNFTPCAADKCERVRDSLQKALPIRCIQGYRVDTNVALYPGLILLRPCVGDAAQELIHSCKEKWPDVPILAVLCEKWDRLVDEFTSFLTGRPAPQLSSFAAVASRFALHLKSP